MFDKCIQTIHDRNNRDVVADLMRLLALAHFQHCLPEKPDHPGGPDFANSVHVYQTLMGLELDNETRIAFVEAMAIQNNVRDDCIAIYRTDDGTKMFGNEANWEKVFGIVCDAVGKKWWAEAENNRSPYVQTCMMVH